MMQNLRAGDDVDASGGKWQSHRIADNRVRARCRRRVGDRGRDFQSNRYQLQSERLRFGRRRLGDVAQSRAYIEQRERDPTCRRIRPRAPICRSAFRDFAANKFLQFAQNRASSAEEAIGECDIAQ